MAYNVLKGIVEGSVDQHADQEIDGIKVFKNTISASVFYDTDAQSPCATMKDVALTSIEGTGKNAVLTYNADGTATANDHLTFHNDTLKTNNVEANFFVGSGTKLTDIDVNNVIGKINADKIDYGPGLQNIRGKLQAQTGAGIVLDEDGLSVSFSPVGGIGLVGNKLVVDASKAPKVNEGGQNLSDSDLLLVSDISKGTVHSTTIANLYDSCLRFKIPHPAGHANTVQLQGKNGFNSSRSFSYDTQNNILNVEGRIKTNKLEVNTTLSCRGAVYANIKTITSEVYEVQSDDYTILCDSETNAIMIVLPPACNHHGRTVIIKKISADKKTGRPNPVGVKVEEGTIDSKDKMVLKSNYSSRTFQSDGKNWWVVAAKGL
jgi:hypothetical protein